MQNSKHPRIEKRKVINKDNCLFMIRRAFGKIHVYLINVKVKDLIESTAQIYDNTRVNQSSLIYMIMLSFMMIFLYNETISEFENDNGIQICI